MREHHQGRQLCAALDQPINARGSRTNESTSMLFKQLGESDTRAQEDAEAT